VHVVQLFDSLLQTPDVEVVKPALPETRQRGVAVLKVERHLPRIWLALPAQAPRDALLDHLNHGRWGPAGRLADQQVDVLRHDHEAHECEAEAIPHLAEDLDEDVSRAGRPQNWQALVAGERNEV